MQVEFFALFARLHLARRAVGRGREMRVAQAAASALGEQHALADLGQVCDRLELAGVGVLGENQRADRNRDLEIFSAAAGTQRARAVAAALRLVFGIELKVDEGVAMRIRHRVHGTTHAAVPAVGTAARHKLFTAEAERTAAAVTGLNVDVDFVDELHGVVAGIQ
jgi:hypothetical protein